MAWLAWGLGGLAALLAASAAVEILCERQAARTHPPPGQMVDIGGRRLHLRCTGPTNGAPLGPTVVIEQGAGGPSLLWWPIQERVAAFAQVCTYDRAGYLWSDPAPRQRTLADRAEDLHRVLSAAHIPGPYILVAHSFGGPLVRLFAQRHPTQVAGMVLVDTPEEAVITGPAYTAYARTIARFARAAEIAAHFGVVRLATAALLRAPPAGIPAEPWAAFKALLPNPAYFRATADDPEALNREPATLHALGGLGDMPLVVIRHAIPFPGPAAALEDGWEDGQHRLAALSTRGELVVATQSNHMVQNDEPELVIDAIRRVVEAVTRK